ncbi:MAG TPA: hypothetical protein VEF34_02115, partial [Syntrophobacteraceae bacterium]|nr:hypothetical protein [Syntrophobacteraceae bacterium]
FSGIRENMAATYSRASMNFPSFHVPLGKQPWLVLRDTAPFRGRIEARMMYRGRVSMAVSSWGNICRPQKA